MRRSIRVLAATAALVAASAACSGAPSGRAGANLSVHHALARDPSAGFAAVTHPSLPNYIAATSGATHGIRSRRSSSGRP